LCAAARLYAQSDPLPAIREALTSKYSLTTATADKTDIVTSGSSLTLKKSDLVAGDARTQVVPANNYRYGKISRGFMGQLARGTSPTRTFVAGEKLWVTDIEAKPKGIVFWLLSDAYSGVRYRASLNFPFQNGVPPVGEVMTEIGEVFAVEGAPNAEVSSTPGAALPPTTPNAVPSPVQDVTDWDPRYGRVTKEDLERINDATVRFDVNYLRLNPAALNEKAVMQYFIALNNCNHRDVERALFNELDYPALAAFYKPRAAGILAALPRTITDIAFDRMIGGQQVGNWRLWAQSLTLGEYNSQRKAFPLTYPAGQNSGQAKRDGVDIPEALSTASSGRNLTQSCPAAQKAAAAANRFLPTNYEIRLRPAQYRELPMDEAAARQYIDGAGPQRSVFLAVDVAILDSPPAIDRGANSVNRASFRAQMVRLRVIDSRTQHPVGALFDDGTLQTDRQIAQAPAAPPPPTAKPASEWANGDHMFDIRMSVFVSLAADACGWPLTDEQRSNLARFLDQVSNRGSFNEKYQYNLARGKIKNSINAQGRMNYCANASERRDFDKYAAMVAPLGPLTTSGAK
jgi:hypothetical protein